MATGCFEKPLHLLAETQPSSTTWDRQSRARGSAAAQRFADAGGLGTATGLGMRVTTLNLWWEICAKCYTYPTKHPLIHVYTYI